MLGIHKHGHGELGLLSKISAFLWRWSYQRDARVRDLAVLQVWQRQ